MKKMLVVGLGASIGGMEIYFRNHYQQLRKIYSFDFVTCDKDVSFGDVYRADGATVFCLPSFKTKPLVYYKTLKRIISLKDYDVMYFCALSAANVLPIIAAKKKCRIVVHSHSSGMRRERLKKMLHFVFRKKIANSANVRIACSKRAGKWMFGKKTYIIARNSVNVKKFQFSEEDRKEIREKLAISEDEIVIGNVARFSSEKNHEYMLKILKEVNRGDRIYKLLLVGDGKKYKKIQEYAKKNMLEGNVIFVGQTKEVSRYYNAMDIFILPSRFEGLSLVALEAQSNGLKCIFSSKIDREHDIEKTNSFVGIKRSDLKQWAKIISESTSRNSNNRKSINHIRYIERDDDCLIRALGEGRV